MGSLSHLERMDAVNEVRLLVSISHPNVVGEPGIMQRAAGDRRGWDALST